MTVTRVVLIVVLLLSTWLIPTAAAHGLLKDATPAPDAHLTSAPRLVSVTLTQPPQPNGKLIVRDGCGRVVSRSSRVRGDTIVAAVTSAQPGEWRVRFDFVSATDGHRYARSYAFTVAGRRDCTREPKQERDPRPRVEKPPEGSMASGDAGSHESGAGAPPAGGLLVASTIALAVGLVSRIRPRSG